MDKWSEHIDNKFGGCDIPFDESLTKRLSAEEQEQLLKSAIVEVAEKIMSPLVEAVEGLLPFVKSTIEIVKEFAKPYIEAYKIYPNRRVVWLSLNAKKERVRKKNFRRIWEYYIKHK